MDLKGYKITDAKFEKKYGIGCYNFEDFKSKGCFKLGIEEDSVIIQLMDGTIIDEEEYFETIPSQTMFIFLRPGEKVITGGEIIYNALKRVNLPLLKTQPKIIEWLQTNDISNKLQNLIQIISEKNATNITHLKSKKIDDPDWFEGLDTKSLSKEEFMYRRAQERIRGYFYKTKSEIIKSKIYIKDLNCRNKLEHLIKGLQSFLKLYDYNGKYFDRRYEILCTKTGEFTCQGKWNLKRCKYESGHHINPYMSREMRILFSTWNLDHKIERSRTILPAILEASKLKGQINFEYFGKLLFTLDNLKLVHIICHDKNIHEGAKCSKNNYILME